MKLDRLTVDSDLSESSVACALSGLPSAGSRYLVVSPAGLAYAPKLAQMFGLMLQMEPDLPRDAWYVYNEYFGVFSPGA